MYAPLDAPQQLDGALLVYNVRDGGWIKGPKLSGTILAPCGRLATRHAWRQFPDRYSMTARTDERALIYISYNGVISHSKESFDRLMKGETLTSKDHYFVTAPTMRTSAEKYAWLNHIQCIGKVVEVKAGEGSFVKYDIYILR